MRTKIGSTDWLTGCVSLAAAIAVMVGIFYMVKHVAKFS